MKDKNFTTPTETSLEMSIQLPCTVRFDEDTANYVSECPPLRIISGAETEEDAVAAIRSAIVLYLQSVVEDGCLSQVLAANGFCFTSDQKEVMMAEHYIALSVRERAKSISVKVPFGLLASQTDRMSVV